jgi:hypothetical protein
MPGRAPMCQTSKDRSSHPPWTGDTPQATPNFRRTGVPVRVRRQVRPPALGDQGPEHDHLQCDRHRRHRRHRVPQVARRDLGQRREHQRRGADRRPGVPGPVRAGARGELRHRRGRRGGGRHRARQRQGPAGLRAGGPAGRPRSAAEGRTAGSRSPRARRRSPSSPCWHWSSAGTSSRPGPASRRWRRCSPTSPRRTPARSSTSSTPTGSPTRSPTAAAPSTCPATRSTPCGSR